MTGSYQPRQTGDVALSWRTAVQGARPEARELDDDAFPAEAEEDVAVYGEADEEDSSEDEG